jgi:hypothetical protein
MKKICLIVLLVICNFYVVANEKVFTCHYTLANITNDKIIFYTYDNGWQEIKNMEFKLPMNFTGAFGFFNMKVIGIIIGDKVKIYDYENGWKERFGIMDLPSGYKYIFTTSNRIHVVLDNKILTYGYSYESRSYQKIDGLNFNISDNIKKACVFYGRLSIIYTNNIIKIYEENDQKNGWNEYTQYDEYHVPSDCDNILQFNVDIGYGLIKDDRIIFYEYNSGRDIWMSNDIEYIIK